MFKRSLCPLAPLLLCLLLAGCASNASPAAPPDTTPSTPVTPVSITTKTLPYADLGTPYRVNLQATNGFQPYTFSLAEGSSLPTGFTLSPTGSLSGLPTTAGTFPFVAQVADASTPQNIATQAFSLTIGPPLAIVTSTLPPATVGSPYNSAIQIAGGTLPYTFAPIGNTLPTGLTLSTTGVLSGTPTLSGTATFSVLVADSSTSQRTLTANLTLTIKPLPLFFSYPSTPIQTVIGTPISQAPILSGGAAPYTFAISNGALPTGLTLNPDGSVSGTPTGTPATSGITTIEVAATDSSSPAQTVIAALPFNVIDAVVQVDTTTTLATVPQTAFGIHTSVYDSSLSDTAALPALLQTTGITTLRYPGGSYSDAYHWAQYTTTPFFASTVPACNVTPNGYLAPHSDFGSFIKTLAATNTQAIITVNYGTSLADAAGTRSIGTQGGGTITPSSCSEPNTSGQPQEAAAWVAYANGSPSNTQVIGLDAVGFDWKTVGFWATLRASAPLPTDDGYNFLRLTHPTPIAIQYWELGNEIYYNGYSSSGSEETDLHAPYVYPSGYTGTYNSRAGIAALSPTAYGTNAVAYLQAMRAVDPTIKIGFVLSAPTIDPIDPAWNPAALTAVCASATFDFAIEHYYPGTYNDVTASELLYSPQVNLPTLVTTIRGKLAQSCPVNGTTIPIFLTETNANGTLATGVPAAVTGLYAAHVFLSALESGISNIEWLELHDTTGSYLATTTEAPGPAFYGIQLAHLLANVGDALVSTSSSNSALIAHATSKANGQQGILLLNSDPTNASTVQVTVTGSTLGTLGTTATQYSYGIATTQSTAALASTTLPITGNTFTITVPPLTATELLIP